MEEYLKEGRLTHITQEVKKIADSIESEGLEFVFKVLELFEKEFTINPSEKKVDNRYRTTEQIIEEKILWGCTDNAHFFAAICRAKGIPAKYVEGIWEQWLKSNESKMILGHAVNAVFINGKWYWVDPQYRSVSLRKPSGLIIYKEGLDLLEIGIPNSEELCKQFFSFRKEWQKNHANK